MSAVAVMDTKELLELEAEAWELERADAIPPDFGGWLDRERREEGFRWDYDHMRIMQSELDAVTRGDTLRLLLEVAGRHSKTEHVTSYASYRLALDSATRILFGSYNAKQANRISRKVKRMAKERGVAIEEPDATEEWGVQGGGGFQAVGVGTGVASVNADVIIVDDPIGSRKDAESPAHRDATWDWLTTDILARCEPHTQVIVSMPRWHMDDPAGRIKKRQEDNWRVLHMPGTDEDTGDVLWPALRDEDWHEQMRVELGAYGYASFVLCEPRPREGQMFRWKWFNETRLDEMPGAIHWVRYWDTAGTEPEGGGDDPDYTAGALLGRMADGRTVIGDMRRFRASVGERDERMVQVAREDRSTFGGRVRWYIETETGIGGRERMQHLLRLLQNAGIAAQADPRPQGKKPDLAQPLASKAEAGNLWLVEGEWVTPFLDELVNFPGGDHDDQVDAARGADAKLSEPKNKWSIQRMRV